MPLPDIRQDVMPCTGITDIDRPDGRCDALHHREGQCPSPTGKSFCRAHYVIFVIISNNFQKVNCIFSRKWGKTVFALRKFSEKPKKYAKNPCQPKENEV